MIRKNKVIKLYPGRLAKFLVLISHLKARTRRIIMPRKFRAQRIKINSNILPDYKFAMLKSTIR